MLSFSANEGEFTLQFLKVSEFLENRLILSSADYPGCGQEQKEQVLNLLFSALYSAYPGRHHNLPPIIVWTTFPLSSHPLNGVFFDLDLKRDESTIHRS